MKATSVLALADGYGSRTYAVTITNITSGQTFTPLLVATHKSSVSLFELGTPASTELATIAESGNIEPMATLLNGIGDLEPASYDWKNPVAQISVRQAH